MFSSGGAAVVTLASTGAFDNLFLTSYGLLRLGQNTVTPANGVASVTGAGTLSISSPGLIQVNQDSIAAPTAAQVSLQLSVNTHLAAAQAGITDTNLLPAVTFLASEAPYLAYTAADPGAWTPPAPTTIQEAVDRMARHWGGVIGL
jgi:hypothetical protein